MKSIRQESQLSDDLLKSVFQNDDEGYKEALSRCLSLDQFKTAADDLLKDVTDCVSKTFQVTLEKIISEEFFSFLESIGDGDTGSYRNGYYSRKVRTVFGDFTLQIPRARYESFQTKLLAKGGHALGDIEGKILDLYASGMSESKTADAIASLSGIGISRETVGKIVRATVGDAAKFNGGPVDDCPFVFLDATYIPFKRAYGMGKKAVAKEGILIAMGVTPDGHKKVLGFSFGETERIDRWKSLLESLKARGLKSPRLFITDGLSGMPDAVSEVFPGAKHQRCLAHYMRNLVSYVNRKDAKAICDGFRKVMESEERAAAIEEFRRFSDLWGAKYRGLKRMLSETGDNIFTYLEFPKEIRRSICTSNAIEGLNSKIKRETKSRIQANSEDNATIVLTNICRAYNKSCGLRLFNGLKLLDAGTRQSYGFDF